MSEIVESLKWEDLKVYKPLSKEELKPAFKDFIKIIADNLKPFGFIIHGRKLIRLSNDLFQIIHLDTRGSWAGNSEYFKIKIGLVAICDKSPFLRGVEPSGEKQLEEIVGGLRNHYRITKEYPLLCDFLSAVIIEKVLPYFEKFDSSGRVLNHRDYFKLDSLSERNEDLILFCELQNQVNIKASVLIEKTLSFLSRINPEKSQGEEYWEELELFKTGLETNNWDLISRKLQNNKSEVFKKLKLK